MLSFVWDYHLLFCSLWDNFNRCMLTWNYFKMPIKVLVTVTFGKFPWMNWRLVLQHMLPVMNQLSPKLKLLDEDTWMVLYYISKTSLTREHFGLEAWIMYLLTFVSKFNFSLEEWRWKGLNVRPLSHRGSNIMSKTKLYREIILLYCLCRGRILLCLCHC